MTVTLTAEDLTPFGLTLEQAEQVLRIYVNCIPSAMVKAGIREATACGREEFGKELKVRRPKL